MTESRSHAGLTVRTPEGIVFTLQLAGPVSRLLALCVDRACIAALTLVLTAVAGLAGVLSADLATAARIVVYTTVSLGYAIAAEWQWRGQTLGKRLLRLRVVDEQCRRLQFSQVVVRNLLRAVDALPVFYLVGGISSVLSRRAQRLGDLAGGTVVVRIPARRQPDLTQIAPGKYNSLRRYPHLVARLRQHVPAGTASLALRAVLRRDQFEARARVELFAKLADELFREVQFPEDAVQGLSGEQLVRNATDVLFRENGTGRGGRAGADR